MRDPPQDLRILYLEIAILQHAAQFVYIVIQHRKLTSELLPALSKQALVFINPNQIFIRIRVLLLQHATPKPFGVAEKCGLGVILPSNGLGFRKHMQSHPLGEELEHTHAANTVALCVEHGMEHTDAHTFFYC